MIFFENKVWYKGEISNIGWLCGIIYFGFYCMVCLKVFLNFLDGMLIYCNILVLVVWVWVILFLDNVLWMRLGFDYRLRLLFWVFIKNCLNK